MLKSRHDWKGEDLPMECTDLAHTGSPSCPWGNSPPCQLCYSSGDHIVEKGRVPVWRWQHESYISWSLSLVIVNKKIIIWQQNSCLLAPSCRCTRSVCVNSCSDTSELVHLASPDGEWKGEGTFRGIFFWSKVRCWRHVSGVAFTES